MPRRRKPPRRFEKPLMREPRHDPTGTHTQRPSATRGTHTRRPSATRGTHARRETNATRRRQHGRRRRVGTEYTNTTTSHATAAKKTPSPDNMVLEFDRNLNPSGEPLDKKYSRKYSPTKANAIRDRHNKLHELYISDDFRKKVLELHTPPSPPLSPGRTQKKYKNPVEQAKAYDRQPRYISKKQYEKELEGKKLHSTIPSNPLISETRIATPEKKSKSAIASNSLKRKTPTLKIRSDGLTEKEIEELQDKMEIELPRERRNLVDILPGVKYAPATPQSATPQSATPSSLGAKNKMPTFKSYYSQIQPQNLGTSSDYSTAFSLSPVAPATPSPPAPATPSPPAPQPTNPYSRAAKKNTRSKKSGGKKRTKKRKRKRTKRRR